MASKSRSTITPDSFSVAPNLVGLPLAGPWRRLAAMLIDLLLVVLLVRTGGLVLGFAGALMLLRISAPSQGEGLLRRPVRNALRFGAAFIVFLTLSWTWGLFDRDNSPDTITEATLAGEVGNDSITGDMIESLNLSGSQAISISTNLIRLMNEDDPEDARSRVQSIANVVNQKSSSDQVAVANMLLEVARERNNEVMREAVTSVFGVGNAPVRAPVEDSLARLFVAALEVADTARADTLRGQLQKVLAAPAVERLERRARRAETRADSLEEVLESSDRPHGLRVLLSSLLDDLGLGFGWSALYFTATLALFRGQTPGKRLMGARVIRLDGKPLGWWYAFERFGGYAASLTLGLLGFAQIIWDRNRQGIHDKIVETVVIRG